MLRILIHLLRPTESQLRKRKPSTSLRLKIWLYACLVKALAHFYRRYAIHDTLRLASGISVDIVIRDPDFEHDMSRAGIDKKSRFVTANVLPKAEIAKPKGYRWFYGCFKWQRVVSVSDKSSKVLSLDHTAQTILTGNLKMKAEQATPESFFSGVRLTQADISRPVAEHDGAPQVGKTEAPRLSTRRRVPPNEIPASVVGAATPAPSPQQDDTMTTLEARRKPASVDVPPSAISTKEHSESAADKPSPLQPPPELKKMRGFDVDDSF